MVSVRVYWIQSGNPAKSQKVSVGFDGFFRGFSKTQYTDKNGECHFDNAPGNGTVYVNRKIEGFTTIYI